MSWKPISEKEVITWNEKLKTTASVFYQFPYYVSSEYNSTLSKAIFIKYTVEQQEIAYAAIIELGIFPFKVGIIEDGPVLMKYDVDVQKIISDLKQFARAKGYMHIQVRPPIDSPVNLYLKTDKTFEERVYFPFHLKTEFDWNIYSKPEKELLAGFKLQCRRKIVLAGRVPYKFFRITDEKTLADIRKLFNDVTDTKGYGFLPFRTYEKIYKEGKKYNLCDFYAVSLDDKLVNAVLIVKDAKSFYHYTSALVIKGFHPNESPPAKLHFFIMQNGFYNEHKEFYNISFGGSDNLMRFKELFNPTEIERPPYYTFVIKKNTLHLFSKFSSKYTTYLRNFFKTIDKLIRQS